MTATTIPSGRRTAATWIGATGAFLLLAAAAVFVAVRWDQLTETAKLALVGGLTGGFLVAGRAVRRTLPAMGDVLFHLGAFLVPVDLAAMCLRLDAGWRNTVLAEGVVGVVLFTVLAWFTGSVVLRWAAVASVFTLSAGVAAVTPVPATLVLAVIAVGVEVVSRNRPASAVWAAVAGLAPALGVAAGLVLDGAGVVVGTGTLTELGLVGTVQQSAALASGVLAAYVLARQAGARRDLPLAFLALASVLVGLGTAAVANDVGGDVTVLGLAGLFVALEIVALVFFDDDFWGRPLASAAFFAEIGARIGTVGAALFLAFAPLLDVVGGDTRSQADPTLAAALLLGALGWLAADMRRAPVAGSGIGIGIGIGRSLVRGGGWAEATIWWAVALATAVEIGTMASVPTALAMVTVSTVAVVARRAGGLAIAAVGVPFAVLTVVTHPMAAPLVGLAGAAILAVAARWHDRVELAVEAVAVALGAAFLSATGWLPAPAAVGLAVAATWAVSLLLGSGLGAWSESPLPADDRPISGDATTQTSWSEAGRPPRREAPNASPTRLLGQRLGDVGRVGLLAPLAAACTLAPVDSIGPLVAIAALYALDAFRLRRPLVACGTAAAVQPLAVALAQAAGVPLPWAGFAVAVCAVVWSGLAFIVDDEWRSPFVVAAATGLAVGLVLASGDRQALSDTLLLVGGTLVAAGIGLRHHVLGHAGGVLALAGLFGHLSVAGVDAAEPYVLPVALQLLLAGWSVRKSSAHPVSSWIAYAPAVALAGGTALLERVQGGPGWHALIAGAVGVAAVAVGGWRRLSGPMVIGTALLVAVAVRESLSTLAGVPTWAWLGLGGTILLATAILLERTDTSPLEAGRRVVEVMSERFS